MNDFTVSNATNNVWGLPPSVANKIGISNSKLKKKENKKDSS
jgi:hypothetical protein